MLLPAASAVGGGGGGSDGSSSGHENGQQGLLPRKGGSVPASTTIRPQVLAALAPLVGSGVKRLVERAFLEHKPHTSLSTAGGGTGTTLAQDWAPLLSLLNLCADHAPCSFSPASPAAPSPALSPAFEALQLLVNSPRFESVLPSEACGVVSAVRAFLSSPASSLPLRVASVDLLGGLLRRQAAATEEAKCRGGDDDVEGAGPPPVDKVWFEGLEALAASGCLHPHFASVRLHASRTLRHALVADRHAFALQRFVCYIQK